MSTGMRRPWRREELSGLDGRSSKTRVKAVPGSVGRRWYSYGSAKGRA